MIDVFIRYVKLPPHINGLTVPNDDGTFDVYINSTLCQKRQQGALRHETEHIKKDHFYDDIKPIELVEHEAG